MDVGWASGGVLADDGARLHYHRTGGGGRPLILLHGFSDSGLCWTRVARDLESDYDVILPDARGHGRSERARSGLDPALNAADAVVLIRGLGLHRVALAGHSMGAVTAATVAAGDPGLVACLILEDPAWRDAPPSPRGRWDEIRSVREMPREEALAYCREQHPTWDDAELEPWVESKLQFDLSLLDAPGPDSSRSWREVAAAIQSPTLLLTADTGLGAIVTQEVGEEAARLSRGEVVNVAGAGHNIRRDQFQAYQVALRAFLDRVYPPDGSQAERVP